jgi:uncharacterized SAM-binding protein YcdF (DUF218 family)
VNATHKPSSPAHFDHILELGFWTKKEGYRPATIQGAVKYFKRVARHVDITNPEQVKANIASTTWGEARKERVWMVKGKPVHSVLLSTASSLTLRSKQFLNGLTHHS